MWVIISYESNLFSRFPNTFSVKLVSIDFVIDYIFDFPHEFDFIVGRSSSFGVCQYLFVESIIEMNIVEFENVPI